MKKILSADEFERLRSWAIDIALALLPAGVQWRKEGTWRRFLKQGGLLVNEVDGSWRRHADNTGSHNTITLIERRGGYTHDEALKWAENWLDAHQGFGSCVGEVDENEATPVSRADAQRTLDEIVNIHNTPPDTYWQSRKIDPPYPDCVKALQNARAGEWAAVGILTWRGRTVGVEVHYIDPMGNRTTVGPRRRTFKLEKSPGAVFDIPTPGESTDIVICEGLPDTLTVFRWGKCRCRIIGLPGIGALRHQQFPKGTRVTIVRHGDAADSDAAKALQEGVDHLLLLGCDVHLTALPPEGEDANSILKEHGVEAAQLLLNSAQPAALSLNGEIKKLSRLDDLAYAQARKQAAKELGIGVGVLDAERKKHRAQARQAPDWDDVSDAPINHEEIDLAGTLDGIVTQLQRYIVAPPEAFVTIALWVAHSHLVHHDTIHLTVSPRLGIQAADYDSGKSVTLECVGCLVPNPAPTASISPAYLEHALAEKKLTPLLNEAHLVLHQNSDPRLRRVFNASHRRREAVVRTLEQDAIGKWLPVEFDVWCTMAWASVGELPRDHQSRAVIVNLPKRLAVMSRSICEMVRVPSSNYCARS